MDTRKLIFVIASLMAFGQVPNVSLPAGQVSPVNAVAGLSISPAPMAGFGGFSHYRTITIDHTKVPNTNQVNFPVMFRSPVGVVNTAATAVTQIGGDPFSSWMDTININGVVYSFTYLTPTTGTLGSSAGTQSIVGYSGTPYLATIANGGSLTNASGFDAGFYTDASCSIRIPWEQVYWLNTRGIGEYHFRMSLSHTVDTAVYLCYGNASITTDQSQAASVWDANYVGVYHYPNGTSISVNDSTSNAYNLTQGVVPLTAQQGLIDGGAGSNLNQNAHMSSDVAGYKIVGNITVESWVNFTTSQANDPFVAKWDATGSCGAGHSYLLEASYLNANKFLFDVFVSGAEKTAESPATYNDGIWHYAVGEFNGSNVLLFVDGALVTTGSATTGPIDASTTCLTVANFDSGSANGFIGTLDETRVSNVARAADWIATQYNNQNLPFSFWSIGSQH